MISRREFEDEAFYRQRSTKRQYQFIKFLLDNKEKAFTTKELAREFYGDDDEKSIAKAYFVLDRLSKKGIVEKKMPFWAIKLKEKNETSN